MKEVQESSSNEIELIKEELNKKLEEKDNDYRVKCEELDNQFKEYQQLLKEKDYKVNQF